MEDKNEMIFGIRAVLEAMQAGKEIDKILVKKDLQGELDRDLFAALKGRDIPVQRVPIERLNRITKKKSSRSGCLHSSSFLSKGRRFCTISF